MIGGTRSGNSKGMGTRSAVASAKKVRQPRTPQTFWFVVATKYNRERYARRNLLMQPHVVLDTFMPVIANERNGREEFVFPGYIFVKTYGQWQFLESTYGCTKCVMIGDSAAVLQHRHMRELRRRVKDEQADYNEQTKVRLKYEPNEKVVATTGSFRGIAGVYIETDKDKRIVMMLSILGRQVKVRQAAEFVKPAPVVSPPVHA